MKHSLMFVVGAILVSVFLFSGGLVSFGQAVPSGEVLYGMTLNMPTKLQTAENLLPIIKQNLDAAALTGAKTVRVAIPWSHVQPTKPLSRTEGNWYVPELWIREAKARGFEVLLRLDAVRYRDCNTAAQWMGWTYGCPSNGLPPLDDDVRIKQTGLPSDTRVWTQFVEEMAKRFRADVKYWQIGNEVDSVDFWAGTAQEYVSFLSYTKRALYKIDKSLKLLAAGFTGGTVMWKAQDDAGTLCSGITPEECGARRDRIEFIDYVLKNGGTLPPLPGKSNPSRYGYDVADVHVYTTVFETDEILETWRAWINNDQTSFWVTETGGPLETSQSLTGGCDAVAQTTSYQNRHFRQLVHRAVSFAQYGAERVFWWSIIDYPNASVQFSCMGLFTNQWVPKAGISTYQFFSFQTDQSKGITVLSGAPLNTLGFRLKLKPAFITNGNTDVIILYSENPDVATNNVKVVFPSGSTPKRLYTAGAMWNVGVVQGGNDVLPGFTPTIFLAPAETSVIF